MVVIGDEDSEVTPEMMARIDEQKVEELRVALVTVRTKGRIAGAYSVDGPINFWMQFTNFTAVDRRKP